MGDDIKTLHDVEKEHILDTMVKLKGDIALVCNVLEIGRTTLYRKLKAYAVRASDFQQAGAYQSAPKIRRLRPLESGE